MSTGEGVRVVEMGQAVKAEAVERVVVPARATTMLMAAYHASQAAQERLNAVMESIRATMNVPVEWQMRQEPDGTVWFVPPAQGTTKIRNVPETRDSCRSIRAS